MTPLERDTIKKLFFLVFLMFLGIFAIIFFKPQKAHASDYREPDIDYYYNTLMMPDYPSSSCCGAGDVYQADKVDSCDPNRVFEKVDCALVAIITDTRPDKVILNDGRVIERMHIPVGTRIAIPKNKIRKHPIPNPTEHNIIFVKPNEMGGFMVYCWEPVVGI